MANPGGTPENLKPFKPKWSTKETKVIRVPAYLADRLLRYAHQVDSWKDKRDRYVMTADDVREMLDIVDRQKEVLKFPRNNFNRARKDFFSEQIERLLKVIPSQTEDCLRDDPDDDEALWPTWRDGPGTC